ncbi:unnamed protein product, partial [Iphiclides podalirius]
MIRGFSAIKCVAEAAHALVRLAQCKYRARAPWRSHGFARRFARFFIDPIATYTPAPGRGETGIGAVPAHARSPLGRGHGTGLTETARLLQNVRSVFGRRSATRVNAELELSHGFAFSQEEGGTVSQADVIRAYDTSQPRQARS